MRGQSLWEKNGKARVQEKTRNLFCLKVPLSIGKRRAIANFEKEFIPC